jgi:hypothetical protein
MFNIEKAHYILDEMIMNGQIIETNKTLILGISLQSNFKHLCLLLIKAVTRDALLKTITCITIEVYVV